MAATLRSMEPRNEAISANVPRDDAIGEPADVHEAEPPLTEARPGAGLGVAGVVALALLLAIGALLVVAVVSLF